MYASQAVVVVVVVVAGALADLLRFLKASKAPSTVVIRNKTLFCVAVSASHHPRI